MTRSCRPFLWLLLAAALFMRALLPQGYMPERSESGAIAVRLCNSASVHLIPLEGEAAPEEDRQRAEPPCAFAGLASPAIPSSAGSELPLPAVVAVAYVGFAPTVTQGAVPRLLPPATGPPLPA
jgi:hypothetical protein